MTRQIKALCGAVLLLLAGQASALTTWTLNTGTVNGVGTDTTITAAATGWANTGAQSVGGSTNANTQALELQPAGTNLRLYNGLGINNLDGCSSGSTCDVGDMASNAPEHAIDNEQRKEMVLVSFNAKVNLTGVTFGWIGSDSDYTILAYTGASAPSTLAGQTWGALQSGWTAIGNYANATTSSTPRATGTSVFSSYWLIGAYNTLAGGTTSGMAPGNDYLKLKSVAGTVDTRTPPQGVPEPGSLALIGLALLSMLYMTGRRRA